MKILIQDVSVITANSKNEVLCHADIVVTNDTISYVGPTKAWQADFTEVIDGGENWWLPASSMPTAMPPCHCCAHMPTTCH